MNSTNKSTEIYRSSKNLGSAQELQRILSKVQNILPLMLSFKENQRRHAMCAMEARLKRLFNGKLNQEVSEITSLLLDFHVFPKDKV